jgi:mono/diheme cytochrome c family protein
MSFHTASLHILLAVSALLGSHYAYAQPAPAQSRGELLYTTHCIACHTTQMHWRNDRTAVDWDTLKLQVRRWQGNARLEWSESDIVEVARHLNETIYHFPQTDDRVSLASRRLAR